MYCHCESINRRFHTQSHLQLVDALLRSWTPASPAVLFYFIFTRRAFSPLSPTTAIAWCRCSSADLLISSGQVTPYLLHGDKHVRLRSVLLKGNMLTPFPAKNTPSSPPSVFGAQAYKEGNGNEFPITWQLNVLTRGHVVFTGKRGQYTYWWGITDVLKHWICTFTNS